MLLVDPLNALQEYWKEGAETLQYLDKQGSVVLCQEMLSRWQTV